MPGASDVKCIGKDMCSASVSTKTVTSPCCQSNHFQKPKKNKKCRETFMVVRCSNTSFLRSECLSSYFIYFIKAENQNRHNKCLIICFIYSLQFMRKLKNILIIFFSMLCTFSSCGKRGEARSFPTELISNEQKNSFQPQWAPGPALGDLMGYPQSLLRSVDEPEGNPVLMPLPAVPFLQPLLELS